MLVVNLLMPLQFLLFVAEIALFIDIKGVITWITTLKPSLIVELSWTVRFIERRGSERRLIQSSVLVVIQVCLDFVKRW